VLKGAIARRYAEAVLEIAVQQRTVDQWLADIRLIGEAFGNRHLAFVLREPKIPAQRKELVIRDLLGAKVQPDALNLALVLAQDGLVEIAPRLTQEFERLYDEYRGQAKAQVTTALPLAADERALIASDLQRITGKRIILEERVDPAILGGVIARVGDTLIDGSVKRRLLLLREHIAQGTGPFGGPLDGQSHPEPGPDGSGGGPAGSLPPSVPSPDGAPSAPSGDGRAPSAGPSASGPFERPTGATSRAPGVADAPHAAPRATVAPGGQPLGQSGSGGAPSSNQQSRRNGGRARGRRR
jgi:F-type H+-transporting ATPase subunit delta